MRVRAKNDCNPRQFNQYDNKLAKAGKSYVVLGFHNDDYLIKIGDLEPMLYSKDDFEIVND